MESQSLPSIKVVVLGEALTGKTMFVRSLWTGFDDRYVATLGVEVTNLQFNTNTGSLAVSVWDTAGQDKLSGLRDEYILGAHGAVIVTDVNRPQIERWVAVVRRVAGQIPVVVVGNKLDTVMENNAGADPPQYTVAHSLPFVQVSAKLKTDTTVPFQLLFRQICNQPGLSITQIINPS